MFIEVDLPDMRSLTPPPKKKKKKKKNISVSGVDVGGGEWHFENLSGGHYYCEAKSTYQFELLMSPACCLQNDLQMFLVPTRPDEDQRGKYLYKIGKKTVL